MGLAEILIIAVGLAMDAFAVSVTNGMCYKRLGAGRTLTIGMSFGIFQGVMPLIGFLAGSVFATKIGAADHWIALVLLLFIGGNMLRDAFSENEEDDELEDKELTFKILMLQAIATSVDALVVGVSFAALEVDIMLAVTTIAVVTFIMSIIGVKIGKTIGNTLNKKAQIFGGAVLILIGIKIFAEHMWP